MKILLATHNKGKVEEFQAALKPYDVQIISAEEANIDEPEETGKTFHENAELKARAAFEATGLPALADDSGLCVNALGGDPGIYSARWAGPDRDFKLAMEKVNDKLGDSADRSGAFVCVLAYIDETGQCRFFEGRVEGTLVWPPRGLDGFGYDPFFMPDDRGGETFGEMDFDLKQKLSHRARALENFIEGQNL